MDRSNLRCLEKADVGRRFVPMDGGFGGITDTPVNGWRRRCMAVYQALVVVGRCGPATAGTESGGLNHICVARASFPRGPRPFESRSSFPRKECCYFQAWHYVLNCSFPAIDDEEDDAFDLAMEQVRIPHLWPFPEPFYSRVIASWQRIFDLGAADATWWRNPSEHSIQAAFWELDLASVRRVDCFKAR